MTPPSDGTSRWRTFFIDNLLVRIHLIVEMILVDAEDATFRWDIQVRLAVCVCLTPLSVCPTRLRLCIMEVLWDIQVREPVIWP